MAHQQRVLGIYGEYQVVKEPWTLRLGLRKEWTREKVSYVLQPRDDFRTSSDDWFLSLLASYELSASSTLSLSYRSNITRPSIRHLSPRSVLQDPSYVYYGNPKLRSEKHHTWGSEWSYTKEELLLNLSASYSYSKVSGCWLVGLWILFVQQGRQRFARGKYPIPHTRGGTRWEPDL